MDQVHSTAAKVISQLVENQTKTAAQFSKLGEILVSDYGKLKSAGTAAGGTTWWNNSSAADVAQNLKMTTERWAYSELLPVAYIAWVPVPLSGYNTGTLTTSNFACWPANTTVTSENMSEFKPFKAEPAGGQLQFASGFTGTPGDVKPTSLLWALAFNQSKDAFLHGDSPRKPPGELVDKLFASPREDGLGLAKALFFTRNFRRRTIGCAHNTPSVHPIPTAAVGPISLPGEPTPSRP